MELMEVLFWLEKTFLYIMIYGFAGWVYETIICSIEARRFVDRGFLNGPYCPIYGFGAMLDVIILGNIENAAALFFLGMLLDTVLEYVTSYVMEALFHARWWDYSTYRFNINGRVCLLGAVVFGAFSLLAVKVVHPAVAGAVGMIPTVWLHVISAALLAGVSVDVGVTVTGLSGFDEKLREITSEVETAVSKRAHELGVAISGAAAGVGGVIERVGNLERTVADAVREAKSAALESLSKRLNSQQSRMIRSFPHLRSVSYQKTLSGLREFVLKRRGKKNNKDD